MDKETTILIIAQNGLTTAAALFTAKATKLEKQADKATDPATKTKLTKQAAKTRKLAAVLTSADTGITTYLKDTASDDDSLRPH
jgi:CRISPR/Cas system CMR-associated protein Cmr5 small subunit